MKRTKKIAAFLILFLCASMLLVLPTSAKSRKKYDLKVSDVKVSSIVAQLSRQKSKIFIMN